MMSLKDILEVTMVYGTNVVAESERDFDLDKNN